MLGHVTFCICTLHAQPYLTLKVQGPDYLGPWTLSVSDATHTSRFSETKESVGLMRLGGMCPRQLHRLLVTALQKGVLGRPSHLS